MSLLVTIEQNPVHPPVESEPATDRLIAGNPLFKTWAGETAQDGQVKTGIWEATAGTTRSVKGDTCEICYILQGVVELTPEGGEPVVYRAGDCFMMKPGYIGSWRTIETVKKIYVTVG